jgi:recombinational DNA repair ATPase RecF
MISLRRLEVEGGFLDGLDLTFSPGLNVLIGARGSGKTSVIELLRYCLRVPAVTPEAQRRAEAQALWVIKDGIATLSYEIDGVEHVVRRGPNQEDEAVIPASGVLFVSQKEIETIGANASSRRHIVDAMVSDSEDAPDPRAEIEKTARQLHQYRAKLDDVVQQLNALSDVPKELDRLRAEQEAHQSESRELELLQAQAAEISEVVGGLAAEAEAVAIARDQALTWLEALDAFRELEPDLNQLPGTIQTALDEAMDRLRRDLSSVANGVHSLVESLTDKQREYEAKTNAQRRELAEINARIERLEEGAGKLSRALSALREQEKRRTLLQRRSSELEAAVAHLSDARDAALDAFAASMDMRFRRRRAVARELNEKFDDIKIDVIKAGEVSEYVAALGRALEGSGLQWRSLAEQIGNRMSPRELIEAVDSLDAAAVADATGVSVNRAKRLVSRLASVDTTEIALANIEDSVQFSLLDGQDWKVTERLSLGQRCTVVLPLLLAQDPDLAVLDQPEDHLDNAFIVEAVVDVLQNRRPGTQRLIATHNANIPVLGDAEKVIVMGSSGSRAFVALEGPLDSQDVVAAITELMEGGEDAFRRRAEFYGAR